ncbi:DUF72 domain-containing protein [Deinococcus sp. Arct2-2]|uniref:DUF72 domain-containing protein n=1 Tax=Deinococcus sp. Arct2-2 TaxID=2568653 RepID=UPI001F10F724|nr:DUF72 domain-containing protein [Deinococcus sp. Arct2-2]
MSLHQQRVEPDASGRQEIPLYIGCPGWHIASAQRSRFGAGESVLQRYATRLNAAEINSSFYRPHRQSTYQRWADTVPDAFRFSVKLPRTINHHP